MISKNCSIQLCLGLKSQWTINNLSLLYVTGGSGCLNWPISSLDDKHDAAENSSMLEFAWMPALFILGMPCLLIAVFSPLGPSPMGPQCCCGSTLHLVSYLLMLLIWCAGVLPRVCAVGSSVPSIKDENLNKARLYYSWFSFPNICQPVGQSY